MLRGPPGVGKTRLAVEYAIQHQASYPGGTFFVQCDAMPPPDLVKLLRLLGQPQYADERIEEQCRRALAHLGDRPTLLVYDNVPDERVLNAVTRPPRASAPQVWASAATPSASVARGSQGRASATSNEVLGGLTGGHRRPVQGT